MTQQKIDDLFSITPSSTRSGKRSRLNPTTTTTNNRDEFDDLFETDSSAKRRRTNNIKPSTDVFDFDTPSTSTNIVKKRESGRLTKKRSITDDDDDKAIDELFNNDTRKKLRRPVKQEETNDILDLFKTKTSTNMPQTIKTLDDFKTPISSKNLPTQKKIKMFFDDTDLVSLREQTNEPNDVKDYVHIKPVIITGGQWLSKEEETKSICGTMEKTNNPTITDNIPDDQRNLMHIQYAPLIVDDEMTQNKKTKRTSQTRKSSKVLDGKSFQKQLVLSDSTVVRKENLQSCFNALLEDITKPTTTSSNKQKKSSKYEDEEQTDNVDFFDLPTRKKKY